MIKDNLLNGGLNLNNDLNVYYPNVITLKIEGNTIEIYDTDASFLKKKFPKFSILNLSNNNLSRLPMDRRVELSNKT
ncbi:hypothetical protein [Candidatus Cytomitobacter indipagum]|uniref:hypothetical protein n=1 Tax=Candidatus Cytomitobacter indipagum TaxID=2601575 RepID=UPI001C0EC1F3|nr:hypothetical protein [Candidatus Cytomitobacter indipagum]